MTHCVGGRFPIQRVRDVIGAVDGSVSAERDVEDVIELGARGGEEGARGQASGAVGEEVMCEERRGKEE